MPKMNIEKSIVINKSPEKVFEAINNFNSWSIWSPWLIAEPEAKVNVAKDGKFYDWEGTVVGSGNMKVLEEKANEYVHYDLNFLKPWKSTAKVSFYLSSEGKGTQLRWTMNSSLPFFLFWMKKSMEYFVGMDYERGLNMLKDYVEDGKVHCKIDFNGITNFPKTTYVGIKTKCKISELGTAMSRDFENLIPYSMKYQKDNIAGPALSIYHKWNPLKDKAVYMACVPLKQIPDDLPGEYITGTIPETKVHSVTHTGSYRHIPNVWSVQMMHQRAKKFKRRKGIPPMEVYHNSPKDTPEKKLKSEIIFPVKE